MIKFPAGAGTCAHRSSPLRPASFLCGCSYGLGDQSSDCFIDHLLMPSETLNPTSYESSHATLTHVAA